MEFHSVIMDNDSGYASHHNPESNLESSFETVKDGKSPNKSFYMSEDALLEKPRCCPKNDSFDSVINASQSSTQTNFSGFEDTETSDDSIIRYVNNVVVKIDNICDNSESAISTNSVHSAAQECNVTVRDDDENKENISPPLALTPVKKFDHRFNSSTSPDLFDDEEIVYAPIKPKTPPKQSPKREQYIHKNDVKLLKSVQAGLSGVWPPPSVTTIQISAETMLDKIRANQELFCTANVQAKGRSLLVANNLVDHRANVWPEILGTRYHGLHHNRSKVSEEFEHLCSKYAERFVGAETQSSCTVFDANSSPSKRRSSKPRWAIRSPGRRLSHLARRRITFSSASTQPSTSSSIVGTRAHQILIDARKLSLLNRKKSPRKTPSKSPFKHRKSPSSSAKKRLALRMRQISAEFENMQPSSSAPSSVSSTTSERSVKRILFSTSQPLNAAHDPLLSLERKITKRALFQSPNKSSPQKKSPFSKLERKRKRSESDENNPPKSIRSLSSDILGPKPTLLNRSLSENVRLNHRTEELSDAHKKKLQWAVYESLKLQNITPSHPQYKIFASVLARVTRRFLPPSNGPRPEGSTSERMLRIARHHSYAVVKGRSVDEIVNEYLRNKAKMQRPQGYIGVEEFNLRNSLSLSGVLQDRSNVIRSGSSDKQIMKPKNISESRIDRIRKVISFEDKA